MGWVKKVHGCNLPLPSKCKAIGSIWKCRKCKKKWRLVEIYRNYDGESTSYWSRSWL